MKLTEMFNICETCAYAPCLCGNEPENCVAYTIADSWWRWPKETKGSDSP